MIASTELGVYVKWALLLQEQLELVRGEHAVLLQHCERLQVDNQLLRKKLFDENPSKYANLRPDAPVAGESEQAQSDAATPAALRGHTSSQAAVQADGASPAAAQTTAQTTAQTATQGLKRKKEEDADSNQRQSRVLEEAKSAVGLSGDRTNAQGDVMCSPNLRMLASFLKGPATEAEADARRAATGGSDAGGGARGGAAGIGAGGGGGAAPSVSPSVQKPLRPERSTRSIAPFDRLATRTEGNAAKRSATTVG